MSSIFDSIRQGVSEAIEYEKGHLPSVKTDRITVAPPHTYSAGEIKEIRTRHSMTQRLFAEALGVSAKTVEAWESGTNRPSGIANRMLYLLCQDEALFERYGIVARK